MRKVIISIILSCFFSGAFAGDGWVRDAQILGVGIISTTCMGHVRSGVEISIADNVTWPSGVTFGNGHEATTEYGSSYPMVYRINISKNAPQYKDVLAAILSAKASGLKVDIYLTNDETINTYPNRPTIKFIQIK